MIPSNSTIKLVQLSPYKSQQEEWLLFAKKIRKGLGNGTALDDIREFIVHSWQHYIKNHFYREVKIIMPFIKSREVAAQFQKEHDDIRELILSLNHHSNRSLFSILANFIENHIRFVTYSFLENIFTAVQLDVIFNDLEKQQVICKKWNYEFWMKR